MTASEPERNLTSELMAPLGAMGSFVREGKTWHCRNVALAHPGSSFEEIDGVVPAIWLAREGGFPGFHRRLLRMLSTAQASLALSACTRARAKRHISEVLPCLIYAAARPELAQRRRRRREGKFVNWMSKVLAACADAGLDPVQAKRVALLASQEAACVQSLSTPMSARTISGVDFGSMLDTAWAQAEARLLARTLRTERDLSPREIRRL